MGVDRSVKIVGMDLTYPPEAEAFRAEIRAWLEENLPDGWFDDDFELKGEDRERFNSEWTKKLYEGGWICATWPEEYGGKGLSTIESVVLNEEFSRANAPMRADFFDRPLEYPEFAEALGRGLVTVGPPTRDGLAQAIAAPARGVDVELEPGLVGRIIADVENQPGGLPLLQYALTEDEGFRANLDVVEDPPASGVAGRVDGVEVRLALRCLLPHCPERWPLELYWDAARQENDIGRAAPAARRS